MAESYLGGHTVIGRRSGWFSRNKPKVLRRQDRVHPNRGDRQIYVEKGWMPRGTATFRQAVVKAIGCSHGKAALRRILGSSSTGLHTAGRCEEKVRRCQARRSRVWIRKSMSRKIHFVARRFELWNRARMVKRPQWFSPPAAGAARAAPAPR